MPKDVKKITMAAAIDMGRYAMIVLVAIVLCGLSNVSTFLLWPSTFSYIGEICSLLPSITTFSYFVLNLLCLPGTCPRLGRHRFYIDSKVKYLMKLYSQIVICSFMFTPTPLIFSLGSSYLLFVVKTTVSVFSIESDKCPGLFIQSDRFYNASFVTVSRMYYSGVYKGGFRGCNVTEF